jgi:hypothetical protein
LEKDDKKKRKRKRQDKEKKKDETKEYPKMGFSGWVRYAN